MAISGGVPQSNNVQLQTIMDFNTLLLITILILVAFWFVGLVRKIRALQEFVPSARPLPASGLKICHSEERGISLFSRPRDSSSSKGMGN